MTARNASKTITAAAAEATVKREFTADERAALVQELEADMAQDIQGIWDRMGFKPASVQSTMVKFISRVALYSLGVVCTLYAVSAISMAMLMGGWPLFLIACIEIFSLVLGVLGSWMLSDRLVNFVADGGVSRVVGKTGSWIKSKFSGGTTFIKQRMNGAVH